MSTLSPTNALTATNAAPVPAAPPTGSPESAIAVAPEACSAVVAPSALLERLAKNTTGHVRAKVHMKATNMIPMPTGPAVRVRMPPKPRASVLVDFENVAGKLKVVAGSVQFKEPIIIKNLGTLQRARGLRKHLTDKLASFELTGLRMDALGNVKPMGTVLIAKRFATHHYDAAIPTFNINDIPKSNFKDNGLSANMFRGLQTALNIVTSGSFMLDTKSRLGEEVLLDATKVALGNETYVGIGRTAISADVQGKFRSNGRGVAVDIFPPACGNHTVSCNTIELDLRAHVEACLESTKRENPQTGKRKKVLGLGIYAKDAVASVHHLDLGLRADPKAPVNNGRLVGGSAWRPCQAVPAVVVTLHTLKMFAPGGGQLSTQGCVDADAALSFVEPVNPDQVLAAHTRNLYLKYDGKLDAIGDVTFTQPSGDGQPPAKMVQHVKVLRDVNMSGDMEPMEDEPRDPSHDPPSASSF